MIEINTPDAYYPGATIDLQTNKKVKPGEQIMIVNGEKINNIAKAVEVKTNPPHFYAKYSVTCSIVA